MKAARIAASLAGLTVSAAMLAVPGTAAAQSYPNKPVRVIVPFAPGGSTDIIARLVGERMGRELGQPFVIENRGGGGGAIGASEAARAAPDGYTLSIATVSTMAINPACNPKLGYDPLKDFQPVTNFAHTANVLAVNPKVPANDFKSFLELAKKEPGKFSFATSGTCSINHFLGELFQLGTGAKIVHIPYRGSGPAIADVVGGQVQMLFDNLPSSMPNIQAGKLKALAVAWDKRVDGLPDVPTFKELGLPLMNDPAWYGLLAPAGTPADIINKLRDAAVKVLSDPQVKDTLAKQGAAAVGNTPAEFRTEIEKELNKAKEVVKKQNIKLE
ncbi:tripartite tricarboxylate transporter substrate binding protein BugE [Pigmentiphaga sp. GD03639]|uniref:Tripartite tricarboxylate transporter substrate binding protein BugE n=2 Tax=Alcaligenaceae TaxID=506 RepID=A0ABN1BES2_9BURK|nr:MULTISPECIES: tripartite tricarboxylate transporter substrate binding protein BugE [unclassified Pigmentiphaga]MDH2238313.1 tripartite tricarboxylate transporter substrate binding protein BugE [Pigmentiphaga sp. GD03639]OVZ60197.1 ABC transporter substrate-binding protein [Pigmentiphaga sp. NML030171]